MGRLGEGEREKGKETMGGVHMSWRKTKTERGARALVNSFGKFDNPADEKNI